MSDIELCYLSASEALGRFKARQLSPVELMQAVIARAEKVEPKINAFRSSTTAARSIRRRSPSRNT
jgi:Asp-tRNA(Asn)/Glu-tRNA(Gln) amidotransferase A subunit family amidase